MGGGLGGPTFEVAILCITKHSKQCIECMTLHLDGCLVAIYFFAVIMMKS